MLELYTYRDAKNTKLYIHNIRIKIFPRVSEERGLGAGEDGNVGWGEVESKKRRYWDGVCSQTQHHPDLLPIHICILIVSSG